MSITRLVYLLLTMVQEAGVDTRPEREGSSTEQQVAFLMAVLPQLKLVSR